MALPTRAQTSSDRDRHRGRVRRRRIVRHVAAERLVDGRRRRIVVDRDDRVLRPVRDVRLAVRVDRRDRRRRGRKRQREAGEARERLVRGGADDVGARAGRAGDVRSSGRSCRPRSRRRCLPAQRCPPRPQTGRRCPEGRAERHVDDVHAVVDRPFDRVDGLVRRAYATEHADGIQMRSRSDPGPMRNRLPAYASSCRTDRRRCCRSRARRSRRRYRSDVRAVTVAVERVGIGLRNELRTGPARVVGVTDEVESALDLGGGRAEERRVRGKRVGGVCRLVLGSGGHGSRGTVSSRACSRSRCR